MREIRPWASILLLVLLGVSSVGRSDQREGAVPDMLVGVLASAKVNLEPESLIHALATHADPSIRGLAAEALGLLGEKSAEPALLRALASDADRQVREASALALARLGNSAGMAAAKELMRSSDNLVRRLTLAAQLAELGEADGFSFVAEAAASKKASTKSLAVPFLTPFVSLPGLVDNSGRSPEKILVDLAHDENPDVRLTVVRSLPAAVLHGLNKESAKGAVQQLADRDPEPSVRESAKSLLEAWRFDDEEEARRKAGV